MCVHRDTQHAALNIALSINVSKTSNQTYLQYLFSFMDSSLVLAFPNPSKKHVKP